MERVSDVARVKLIELYVVIGFGFDISCVGAVFYFLVFRLLRKVNQTNHHAMPVVFSPFLFSISPPFFLFVFLSGFCVYHVFFLFSSNRSW